MSLLGNDSMDYASAESSDFREAGWITRSLGEMIAKSRENDVRMREISQRRIDAITQQALARHEAAMERQAAMPPEQVAQIQREASAHNEQVMREFNSTLDDLFTQTLTDMQTWTNGYIGAIWTDSTLDYLGRTPVPTVAPIQDIIGGQTVQTVQDILDQFQAEVGAPVGRDLNDLMDHLQDAMNGLLTDIGRNELPEGREGIRETFDYEQAAAEGLSKIFTPDVIANWDRLTMQQRCDCIGTYTDYLCRTLGVEITQVAIRQMGEDCYGIYTDHNKTIELNAKIVENPAYLGELLDTIIHETRHGFQHEALLNPGRYDIPQQTLDQWRLNFADYKRLEDDIQAYWEQPVERDARNFAAEVMWRAGLISPMASVIS